MKLKRGMDIFLSVVALIGLMPLLIFAATVSLILQGRPIFFIQKRIGKKNTPFWLIKFRTMSLDKDKPEHERISWWGKLLRKSSIDELPELINILKGEMSLVGPRPLLEEYLPFYSQEQIRRHDVLPGLTGLAQINGRNGLSWHEKFELDLKYIKNQSLWLDLKIIFNTFYKVILAKDINSLSGVSMSRFDDPFYVVGAGGHGKAVLAVCERASIDIRGVLDDTYEYNHDQLIISHKLVGKIKSEMGGRGIIAIGNNEVRKKLSQAMALNWETVICPSAIVHPSAKIGEGSIIMSGAHIGPDVKIGKHCIVNNGVNIEHDCMIDDFTHLAPNSILCGSVSIGKNCFIGANSTIINNINVFENIVIGAGSTVTQNISQAGTYVGSPARRLKEKIMIKSDHNIKMAAPIIEQDDIEAVVEVMKSGHLSLGPKIIEFEKKFTDYTGCKHAVAVSSGTAGLHLSLLSMGIGPGDEVIVPSFTFVSSVSTIVHVGATPVFVDIEPETFCLDPQEVEKLVTPKTKAILAVDVFGHPANWTELQKIASKHNLYTIDDSCEALGARWSEEKVGKFADTSIFAFYPNKQITTGEGGIIVTDDDEIAEKLRMLRNHGRSNMGKWLKHDLIGYNYRMNEMSAALGVSQMNKLGRILDGRELIANTYNKYFQDFEYVKTQVIRPEAKMSWFVYVITIKDGIDRDVIIKELQNANIPARAYFEPIHSQPMMEQIQFRSGSLKVTENIANRTIALPFHANMTDTEIEFVVMNVKTIIKSQLGKGSEKIVAA